MVLPQSLAPVIIRKIVTAIDFEKDFLQIIQASVSNAAVVKVGTPPQHKTGFLNMTQAHRLYALV